MPGQEACSLVGFKVILSIKKMKIMAANEFEKNVRKEMDEFKLHPSEEVWTKIEERITESKRKRRILFFILSSLIVLTLGGYGIYNLSGNKTKSETQNKLSEDKSSNDKTRIDNFKNEELNKKTITIKPNIPVENIKQGKTPVVAKQKQASRTHKEDELLASISKENPISRDQTTINVDKSEEKKESSREDSTNQVTADVSFNQHQNETDRQNETSKPGDKKLNQKDTALKLEEPKDTISVQVINKKKSGEVSRKITWGINFSAGRSVITEDAFSFKSSYAAADRQYSAPGSAQGGGPVTGGGTGNPSAYYTYPQSQNEPAFAFKAGIHARKNISKRSSLSAGFGYSYLADKIKIGTNQAPSQSSMGLYYYAGSPQKTHTDHFHFIELPLMYNWRVTNNTDHFLSLNAGIAPSYLLSTNALLYDTTMGGIYYYDEDVVTKTHFNFISGIAYQFGNTKTVTFSVGPQFSFDVTKVFKSDLDKRKYFLYTGIDARVFFDRK
jgi:outer membrane protein with beta-barrel domain